jgi:hypothetical protein
MFVTQSAPAERSSSMGVSLCAGSSFPYEQHDGRDEAERHDAVDREAEDAVQQVQVFDVRDDRRHEQRDHDPDEEPARADDEVVRHRGVEAADRDDRDEGGPTRLRVPAVGHVSGVCNHQSFLPPRAAATARGQRVVIDSVR